MHHVMDQEVHFSQKFINMKSHWVKAEGPFLPTSLNESHEVQHLLLEPKSDHVIGHCLKIEDFSCGFDYGMQTNNGGLDSNCKQGGEHERKFGDLDQLLDDVNEVEEFHSTNDLMSTYIEVAEDASRGNKVLHLGNSSSESNSQGSSRNNSDAFGISELSATMVLESEYDNKPGDKGLTCESCCTLRTKHRCVSSVEGSICPTSLDHRNIHRFDTNESHLENGVLSDENVKGHVEASKLESCSRERRLRKPTRRFIEEFADSKSEFQKGRRKAPTKDKYMKIKSTEGSNYNRHKAQMLMPIEESLCGTSIPIQSQTQKGRSKKHLTMAEFLSEDESSAAGFDTQLSAKRYKKHDRRKHQKMWTLTEVMRLVDGIAEYGTGRWTQIKRHLFASSAYRTPIDLRDKWRNLLRASCVNIQNKRGIEQKQSHASRPLPKSLLQRVYELANIHPYPKERNPKSVKQTTSPMHLTEINSLSFSWGRK